MTLVQKAALTVTLFAVANLGFAFAIKHNWIDPIEVMRLGRSKMR
jgi:hypothetical protein